MTAWLDQVRVSGCSRFKELGFPTNRLEPWRHVRLEPALAEYEEPCEDCLEAADKKILELFFFGREERQRLVFINGMYSKKFSSVSGLPAGILLQDLLSVERSPREKCLEPYLAKHLNEETNAFAAINTFHFKDGAFLYLPENAALKEPVHLMFVSIGEEEKPLVFYPRLLAVLESGASAEMIVDHVDLTHGRHFMNAVTEAYLGPGAKLKFQSMQGADGEGLHFLTSRFYLQSGAALDAVSFAKGGDVSRHETFVDFQGENASASVKGLSLLRRESQWFGHTVVHHGKAHCTSRQFQKSVLAGRAKSEFNSRVVVEKGAAKSDSNQLSRSLLLSDAAQSWARPELEIRADDVSCVHGATVGQLDEIELFYLRSRGLTGTAAKLLLMQGFAKEILSDVSEGVFKKRFEEAALRELEKMTKDQG